MAAIDLGGRFGINLGDLGNGHSTGQVHTWVAVYMILAAAVLFFGFRFGLRGAVAP